MDLELHEALALSEDRDGALSQLLPGSIEHDYYRCLRAQHRGELAEADAILHAWPDRHPRRGGEDLLERLRLRQLLHRAMRDPASAADELRDRLRVSHWHEAEAELADATGVDRPGASRPTRLPPGAFDGDALLQRAVSDDSTLAEVTEEGIAELLDRAAELDPARRRQLLSQLGHTPHPGLVEAIALDLDARGTAGFGELAVHRQLTLAQLRALGARCPELRGYAAWASAVVQRLRPPAEVDLALDRSARRAFLEDAWRELAPLPPAVSTLKAHVLWHLLDTLRQGAPAPGPGGPATDARPPAALLEAYLALPRRAAYAARAQFAGVRREDYVQPGADASAATALAAVSADADEELVRDLLLRASAAGDDVRARFGIWLEGPWLELELAAAALLRGAPEAEQATRTLGPTRAAALRERVELQWCKHNPTRLGADDAVVLDFDVKNAPEVVVKVFRIDPVAFFQTQRRELSTDLDLDGLAATHELTLRFAEPPVHRVRHRLELPMCARAGAYVIDLIGNGIASRAILEKGRLRHVVRRGAAGHVVTIIDERGAPLPGARAIVGEREYVADERGAVIVPFSTAPARVPMLLAHGDLATTASLELAREDYELSVAVLLEREGLAASRPARAVARVALTVAGAPASLALLRDPTWLVAIIDSRDVATVASHPLVVDDRGAAVLEWQLGEDVATVELAVQATVEVRSEQRVIALTAEASAYGLRASIPPTRGAAAIERLHLAESAAGWVLYALGSSGEPLARRPLAVSLQHRWSMWRVEVALATDAAGRAELGELPRVASIAADLGHASFEWSVAPEPVAVTLHAVAGAAIQLPLPPGRAAADVIRRASLVELRGGAVAHHVSAQLEPLAGGLRIESLPAGDYELRAPGVLAQIAVAPAGPIVDGRAIAGTAVIEVPPPIPVIAELAADPTSGELRAVVRGASASTRVHVLAARFAPAPIAPLPCGPPATPDRRADPARAAQFVSGRELGDEYRYVLERRGARRFPGLRVDRPSLLLNPWARRATETAVASARAGGAFAAAAMPARPASAAREISMCKSVAYNEPPRAPDFLRDAPAVIANLVPDAAGAVVVPLTQLGDASVVTVVVDDPAGATHARVALPEAPLVPRDLRLALALDPEHHAVERKAIAPLPAGEAVRIDDLATARIHLVDTVERAHAYLRALRDHPALQELAFITRWHALPDAERRELYSKHACHELHLFLAHKDRAFFESVVRPHLVHKRVKTFVDHWLLGHDLAPWLEPARLRSLNAAELALLARRQRADAALPRLLADPVAVEAPDPARDTRLIDALLAAASLDVDPAIGGAREVALGGRDEAGLPPPSPPEPLRALAAPKLEKGDADLRRRQRMETGGAEPEADAAADDDDAEGTREAEELADRDAEGGGGAPPPQDRLASDLIAREREARHFRAAERTQEWAEHNWWRRTPAESGPELIRPSRLWRDLAIHPEGQPFLSPWLGLATGSFAEAMCALAVIDLPFVAAPHRYDSAPPRLTITAGSHAIVGTSQVQLAPLTPGGPPLVVGTTYVRADDREEWAGGEAQVKHVQGPLAAGVVYTCQVVLANPTSARQRVSALAQIPRGSLPVGTARATETIDVALEAYGTHGHEYSFYFPAPGRWGHFPVHVSRDGVIAAADAPRTLEVISAQRVRDAGSWAHVSQHGSLEEVVAYLRTANLAATDAARAAWRLRDRAAYEAILEVLEARRAYHEVVWGYSLLHHDGPRMRTWLRALGPRLAGAGPALDLLGLEGEDLGTYEHLELAPLIHARAHRLGPRVRILNEGLAAQYARFLDVVAHRAAPTSEDLLAAAVYLLAQDRIEPALAALARVRSEEVAERMQLDYAWAVAACLTGDLAGARARAAPWRAHPVDRWRHRFGALLALLDEVDGAAAVIVDARSREQAQAEAAARQPTFDLAVDRDGVVLRSHRVAAIELRYFEMDVELLFSRQPFVQSDATRLSVIEPGHRERIAAAADGPTEQRVPWPPAMRGKNVVVEGVAAGRRVARVHYANDLALQLADQLGQVRACRATGGGGLPAAYVKVYAKRRGGAVAFYKDGYTDLRGWFDYASLSTSELDAVERFAILVCSDTAGAAILEAAPPQR